MNTQLTTQSDIPTHKLVLRVGGDGEIKTIYLTKKQALGVAANINSKDQFIVFRETGEVYPKFAASLTLLTEEEKSMRRNAYLNASKYLKFQEEERLNQEAADQFNKKVTVWIEANQQEFLRVLGEVESQEEIRKILAVNPNSGYAKAIARARAKTIIFERYLC